MSDTADTEQVMENMAQNVAPQDSEVKQLDIEGLHCFNTKGVSNTLCVSWKRCICWQKG